MEIFINSVMKGAKVCYPLKVVGNCSADKHGTTVTFLPDKEIFEETVYDYDTLKNPFKRNCFPH